VDTKDKMIRYTYKKTLYACYTGYITQAIVNNLTPLFFIIFREEFGLSYERLGRLVFLNFGVQILTDIAAVRYADKLGYRKLAVLAHILSFLGLILLGLLPKLLTDSYLGISVAVIIYAIGGGLIEVLISPIVEALPGDAKASTMSLLHSFYCWGQMSVVLISTLLLKLLGNDIWFMIPIAWSIIPIYNTFQFMKVPLIPLVKEEHKMPARKLLKNGYFRIALIIILCAGASEFIMSQWASIFAQRGLHVDKVIGDLLGPCLVAVFMGIGRTIYGILGEKINIRKALTGSAVLCAICYAITVFSRISVISLLGCASCGFSVSLMWPGTYSLSSKRMPFGGTAMFGLLAVMGDVGGAIGPWMAGIVSGFVKSINNPIQFLFGSGIELEQAGLKLGLMAGMIFPIIMLSCLLMVKKENSN
jgi:fucose permease